MKKMMWIRSLLILSAVLSLTACSSRPDCETDAEDNCISPYIGNSSFENSKQLAQGNMGTDSLGIRHEFVKLVDLASAFQPTAK